MNRLIIVCVLLVVIDSAFSISCYNCDQATKPDCGSSDPAKLKPFIVDCEAAGSIQGHRLNRCAKSIDAGKTDRSCYYDRPGFDGQCRGGGSLTACICAGDLCNGGSVQRSN